MGSGFGVKIDKEKNTIFFRGGQRLIKLNMNLEFIPTAYQHKACSQGLPF